MINLITKLKNLLFLKIFSHFVYCGVVMRLIFLVVMNFAMKQQKIIFGKFSLSLLMVCLMFNVNIKTGIVIYMHLGNTIIIKTFYYSIKCVLIKKLFTA